MKKKLKFSPKKVFALTTAGTLTVSNTILNSIDPRVRSYVTFSGGLFLTLLNVENPVLKYMGLGLMSSSVIDTANALRGGAINRNYYNGEVWVLLENGKTLQKLNPHETISVFQKIDGIATAFKKDHIYKVPDACLVHILDNGDIELTSMSKLVNSRLKEKAGWYDNSFAEKYPTWKGLFDKSNSF